MAEPPPPPAPASPTPTLAELLAVERLEVDVFRGVSPQEERVRVFGGQVIAQALRSAQVTVEEAADGASDHAVHSLHAYFLRAGDWQHPILYRVDRIRDGRSFTTRRVVAIQHGQAIFNMEASFQRPESGHDHQVEVADGWPDPDRVWSDHFSGRVETRDVPMKWIPEAHRPARWIWIRLPADLPPELATCALAYASDHGPMGSLMAAHGGRDAVGPTMGASLDHLVWFHRPVPLGEWMRYATVPSITWGTRGVAHGTIHGADGTLVASTTQEGLIRKWDRSAGSSG